MKSYMKFGQKLSDAEMKDIRGKGQRLCSAQCHCGSGHYCGVSDIPEHQLNYACENACQNLGKSLSSLSNVHCYDG